MEMSPTFLRSRQKNQGIDPMGFFSPWHNFLFTTEKIYQNLDNKRKMNFCKMFSNHSKKIVRD